MTSEPNGIFIRCLYEPADSPKLAEVYRQTEVCLARGRKPPGECWYVYGEHNRKWKGTQNREMWGFDDKSILPSALWAYSLKSALCNEQAAILLGLDLLAVYSIRPRLFWKTMAEGHPLRFGLQRVGPWRDGGGLCEPYPKAIYCRDVKIADMLLQEAKQGKSVVDCLKNVREALGFQPFDLRLDLPIVRHPLTVTAPDPAIFQERKPLARGARSTWRPADLVPGETATVPLVGAPHPVAWQGICRRKPWSHQITAIVPCLNHAEEARLCVELLRLQTEKPYIILVDTGSEPAEAEQIAALRAEDVEVHALRRNGVRHSSDLVANALDLGFSMCDTPYAFLTHQDCFLRRRDCLAWFLAQIQGNTAVGYRLSPRKHPDWEKMLGHTATLVNMAEMDRLGVTWSLRRAATLTGVKDRDNSIAHTQGWPDTESCFNTLLLRAKAPIKLLGTEENYVRTCDDWIDHCRSLISSSVYSAPYYAKAKEWVEAAKAEARERITKWRSEA